MKHAPKLSRIVTALLLCALLPLVNVPATTVSQKVSANKSRRATRRPVRATKTSARKPAPRRDTATLKPAASQATSTRSTTTTATPASANGVTPQGSSLPARVRAAKPVEELTFDTLLGADSYSIYVEVRAIGQQSGPGGLMDVLQPIIDVFGAAQAHQSQLEFFDQHAETLARSRMMIAAMPAREELPLGFAALELPSPEAARKFAAELEQELKRAGLLAGHQPPGAAPSPGVTPTPAARPSARVAGGLSITTGAPAAPIPFFVAHVGALVLMSDTEVKPEVLRPAGSEAFTSSPNFHAARSRFPAEALFAYVDAANMRRSFEVMSKRYQALGAAVEESERAVEEADGAAKRDAEPIELTPEEIAEIEAAQTPTVETATPESSAELIQEPAPEEMTEMNADEHNVEGAGPAQTQAAAAGLDVLSIFAPFIFGSRGGDAAANWPEAVALAAGTEGDALALRLLLFNDAETKSNIVPFFPLLVSGPPVAPGGASLVPADTDIFLSLSLDLPRMYEQLTWRMAGFEQEVARDVPAPPPPGDRTKRRAETNDAIDQNGEAPAAGPTAQLAALEKLLGVKLKEDIIDSLGHEVTVGIPASWFGFGAREQTVSLTLTTNEDGTTRTSPRIEQQATPAAQPTPTPAPSSAPVVLLSLRDRGRIETVLPRIARALGLFSGSGTAAAPQKHRGVEMFLLGPYAVALFDNYLALAPDEASLRRLIDARDEGRTLAGLEEFRQATGWQPRAGLGQIYVARALLKNLFDGTKEEALRSDSAELVNLASRLSFDPGPATHAVTNEGAGPLHEVRIPRDLLAAFAAKQAVDARQALAREGEQFAQDSLFMLHSLEEVRKSKNLPYTTLDELTKGEKYLKEILAHEGYRVELTVTNDGFEATATPTAYPERGRRSFFIDHTSILRAADKNGQRATAQDPPVK